jgi:hypothetical protein
MLVSGIRGRAQPPKSKTAEATKLQGRIRPRSTPYGRRSGQKDADTGVRRVAATYGKVLHLTSSPKASDRFVVESDAERVVTHLLTLDPRVQRFAPQPFTVDLLDGRILRTPEEVEAARKRHKGREGRKFYSPDFEVTWLDRPMGALETKLEGFEGDAEYDATLQLAASVLRTGGYDLGKVVVPSGNGNPLRFNLPLLRKAVGREDLLPTKDLIGQVEALLEGGPRTLRQLCSELGLSPNLVPALLVAGVLGADLARQTISGEMLLHAAYGDCTHLCLLDEVAR